METSLNRVIRAFGAIALSALAFATIPATAQAPYPNKPIRVILGVAPGGLIDVTARLTLSNLATRVGQPFVVENRPGADTTIAANAVQKAAPDGYTLFFGGAMSASPVFVKNGAVDFVTQMKPVSLMLSSPFYLLVNGKVPANNLQELVAYSKQHPGKLNYAHNAPASTLVMQAIGERTGLSFTTIPYKGSAPTLMALFSGEVDLALDTVPNYLQHIQSGKVRAFMNTGAARMQVLPEVATGRELKAIEFDAGSMFGLWAPPGTPDAIVKRLSDELAQVAKDPQFIAKFREATKTDPIGSTPEELLRVVAADKALLSGIAKKVGYEPQ